MTLTERLHKLHDRRNTLSARYARDLHQRVSTADTAKELVRVTCKVLRFELKAEKQCTTPTQ